MPIIYPEKLTGLTSPGNVLVACEFSGLVREAFNSKGHNAWSVDFLPTEIPGKHFQTDMFNVIDMIEWDLLIAFPDCTYLASSGNGWHAGSQERLTALNFIRRIMNLSIPKIALENPVGAINSHIRKPDQIIQPWQFGHGETKSTCLWLKGLPKLTPANVVEGRQERIWKEPPRKDRWRNRARTLPGIAGAMADQWG